jgi:hypothetical protein
LIELDEKWLRLDKNWLTYEDFPFSIVEAL